MKMLLFWLFHTAASDEGLQILMRKHFITGLLTPLSQVCFLTFLLLLSYKENRSPAIDQTKIIDLTDKLTVGWKS